MKRSMSPRRRGAPALTTLNAMLAAGALLGAACAPSPHTPTPAPANAASTREAASPPAPAPTIEALGDANDTKGCEQHPTFTPDGRAIIYSTFVDGGWGLMRYDLETRKRSRVTMQNAQVWEYLESFDIGPSVSPDGARVAYLHQTNQGAEVRILPITGDAGADPMVVAEASISPHAPLWTGPDRLLFISGDEQIVEYRVGPPSTRLQMVPQLPLYDLLNIVQTRDQTLVARVRNWNNPNAWSFAVRRPSAREWSLVPFDGGTDGPFMQSGLGLALSRDEKKFYYVVGNTFNSSRVMRRSLDVGERGFGEAVPGVDHVTGGFGLSRDRRQMVFSRCFEYSNLVRVRRGKPPALLLADVGSGGYIQPRRFGSNRVLATSRIDGASTVNVLDLKTMKTTTLPDCDCEQATASPDGQYLVYVKHAGANATGGLRMRRVDDPAAKEVVLTREGSDRWPEWFHDSRHVIFKRGTSASDDLIYIMPVSGDLTPAPLTALGPVGRFAVSPTEDRVVFADKNNQFFIATSRGQKRQLLSDQLGARAIYNRVVFAPDGKRVLLLRGAKEIVEITLAGARKPELLVDLGQTDTWAMDYAPDGDGVVVPLSVFRGGLFIAHGDFQ